MGLGPTLGAQTETRNMAVTTDLKACSAAVFSAGAQLALKRRLVNVQPRALALQPNRS